MNFPFVLRVSPFIVPLALAMSCFAADGSLSPRELDSRIDQAIIRTIRIGDADLQSRRSGGLLSPLSRALMVIEPMLGHRAELRRRSRRV